MNNTTFWGVLLIILILIGCKQADNQQSEKAAVVKKHFPIIYIQPLGRLNEALVKEIAQSSFNYTF